MLHSISWKGYIELILFSLVVYYGYVGVKYFPLEWNRLLGRGMKGKGRDESDNEDEGEEEGSEKVREEAPERMAKGERKTEGKEDGLVTARNGQQAPSPGMHSPAEEEQRPFLTAQALANEVKKVVERAVDLKMERPELIWALHELLGQEPYQALKTGEYRVMIGNVIRFEVESRCRLHLDAEELSGLWKP
jgi:hypothetical protein